MSASWMDRIDWSAPWLAPYAELGQAIASSADWCGLLNRHARDRDVVNFKGLPIRFVPQSELPASEAYEAFIGRTARVPTRDNLHDFFNALIWLHFPCTKARLNQLQYQQLKANESDAKRLSGAGIRHQAGNGRGPLRDAATIFDENAAILFGRDDRVAKMLAGRDWATAFIDYRKEFGRSYDAVLFGHALLEKLVKPFASITAHCFLLTASDLQIPYTPNRDTSDLDRLISSRLSAAMTTSSFFPVPVLGFPGWHPVQDASFYADASVFRVSKAKSVNG